MNDPRPDAEHVVFRGEVDAIYCADFQDYPEVTGGQTLSNGRADLSSGPALVTLEDAQINADDFTEIARSGIVEKTVPAGKGVVVSVTAPAIGGAKGECYVTFRADKSSGGTLVKRVKFVVK
jgi:hypothetical protein